MTSANRLTKEFTRPERVALRLRILAALVDYGVVLGWMALLAIGALVISLVSHHIPDWLAYGTAVAEMLGFLLLVLPVGIYLYSLESSMRAATLGKRAFGLRVTDIRGGSASRIQILARTIAKLVPWEVAHFFVWQIVALDRAGRSNVPAWIAIGLVGVYALPVVYVLLTALQHDGRGPHDLLARTVVIRNPSVAQRTTKGPAKQTRTTGPDSFNE